MGLRDWAKVDDVERGVAQLPPVRAGAFQVPLEGTDRAAYLKAIKGAGVYKRAETAPVEHVPIKDLRAIQRSVNEERVHQYVKDPKTTPTGKRAPGHGGLVDLPLVVRVNGEMCLHDGHHRVTAAKLRGKTHVRARVVDLDKDRA